MAATQAFWLAGWDAGGGLEHTHSQPDGISAMDQLAKTPRLGVADAAGVEDLIGKHLVVLRPPRPDWEGL